MSQVPNSLSSVNHAFVCHRTDFEGAELTFYLYGGRTCLIASEYGRAMGYAEDGRGLVDQIHREWADEFVRGHHYDVLEGENLREFKSIAALSVKNTVSANARNLTIIYEPGADLAGIKTNQPLGKRLRRLVVEEIFPKIRRGEAILPATPHSPMPQDPALLREQRLAERERRLSARQKATALRGWARTVKENNLAGDNVVLAYLNEAASIEVGRPLLESRPTLDSRLYTASEIGGPFGLSGKAIGNIARELEIYNKPEYGEVKMSKGAYNDGLYDHWTYNEKGREMIEAEIAARQKKTA